MFVVKDLVDQSLGYWVGAYEFVIQYVWMKFSSRSFFSQEINDSRFMFGCGGL